MNTVCLVEKKQGKKVFFFSLLIPHIQQNTHGFRGEAHKFCSKSSMARLEAVGTHTGAAGRQGSGGYGTVDAYLPRYGRVWKVRYGRYGTVQYKYSNLYLTFYLFILESEKERVSE